MHPKAIQFYQQGEAMIRAAGKGFVLSQQQTPEEFKSWVRYFEKTGWMPWFMKAAIANPQKEVTMPTQWPQWFDTSAA